MRTILIFILLGSLGCNSGSARKTIEKGTSKREDVPNYDTTIFKSKLNYGQTASFYYSNEYTDTYPPFFISSKDSTQKIIIRYPTLIFDARKQIPFLVYPGEKIIVDMNKDHLPHLSVIGNE